MCRLDGINIAVGNEITIPNCTNFGWTIDNIVAKDISEEETCNRSNQFLTLFLDVNVLRVLMMERDDEKKIV